MHVNYFIPKSFLKQLLPIRLCIFHIFSIARSIPLRVHSTPLRLSLSKASSPPRTMDAKLPQQDESALALKFENLNMANDKPKPRRDPAARRQRRKQNRKKQPADPPHLDGNAQARDQPPLAGPTPRIRRIFTSKGPEICAQPASNPPWSKSTTSHIDQSPRPEATSLGMPIGYGPPLPGLFLTPPNPSVPSAIPGPQPQRTRPPETQPPTPIPTFNYLSLVSQPPTPLTTPQRLLVVLDLNGTLLNRGGGCQTYKPRPFLIKFLDYCLANHTILIWSSALPHNVIAICKELFIPSQREKLLGIWARDTLGLTPTQYHSKVQVYKQLDRIWSNPAYALRHPQFKQGVKWSQKNTILVDDSILKASAQPYNHIEIPEFVRNSQELKTGRDPLGQVTAYLEEARKWNNVSAFVRQRKFEIDRGWAWDWARGKPRVRFNGVEDVRFTGGEGVRFNGGMAGNQQQGGRRSADDDDEGGGVKLFPPR